MNRTLHGSPLESAGENHIARAAFERDVDREPELVSADPAAEYASGSVIAGDAAGQGAVGLHGEIGGGFFLALRGRKTQFPLAGQVPLPAPAGPRGCRPSRFLPPRANTVNLP